MQKIILIFNLNILFLFIINLNNASGLELKTLDKNLLIMEGQFLIKDSKGVGKIKSICKHLNISVFDLFSRLQAEVSGRNDRVQIKNDEIIVEGTMVFRFSCIEIFTAVVCDSSLKAQDFEVIKSGFLSSPEKMESYRKFLKRLQRSGDIDG